MQMSYNNLVQSFCGVTLPKSESLTDWSHRPLTGKQMEYAVDDVRYLIRAYDVIAARLAEEGRLSWVESELVPTGPRARYSSTRALPSSA